MSRENGEQDSKGFKVDDRRRFDAEGDVRPDVEETDRFSDRDPPAGEHGAGRGPLPRIDFSTFVISLGTSVMVHLGEAPLADGSPRKDLELAKQTIDILGILQDKTRGNLSADEARLLDELLYDLRLHYVAASK